MTEGEMDTERLKSNLRAMLMDHESAVLRMAAARVVNAGMKERNERAQAVVDSRDAIVDELASLVEAARKEVANG